MSIAEENQVEVLARIDKAGIFPLALKTGGRNYEIKKVNLMHSINDGAVRIYFFSVSDDANYWKLGFNTESLKWWIEDSYSSI